MRLLEKDPKKRITVVEALNHEWIKKHVPITDQAQQKALIEEALHS